MLLGCDSYALALVQASQCRTALKRFPASPAVDGSVRSETVKLSHDGRVRAHGRTAGEQRQRDQGYERTSHDG